MDSDSIKKKNELKKKYYELFHGKVDKEIIDVVLATCEYNEEKTYHSLIEMAGDSLDILPPSKPPEPVIQQPNIHLTGHLETDGARPINKAPSNLFEQLSGPAPPTSSQNLFQSPSFPDTSNPFRSSPAATGSLFNNPIPTLNQVQYPIGNPIPTLPQTRNQIPTLPFGGGSPQQPRISTSPYSTPPGLFPNPRALLPTPPPSTSDPIMMISPSCQPFQLISHPANETMKPTPANRPVPAPRKNIPQSKTAKYHEVGTLWLVLMRGLPGSGKSHRSREIAGGRGVVLSTDDYFMNNGRYEFAGERLPEAHTWNRSRAQKSMQRRLSPVVIDNTNVEAWHMKPYVADAIKFGYEVDIHEMDTAWCFNCSELARKNKHNVNKQTIERLLEKYEKNITSDFLKFWVSTGSCPSKEPPPQDVRNCSQLEREVRKRNNSGSSSSTKPRDIPQFQVSATDDNTNLGDLYFDGNYMPTDPDCREIAGASDPKYSQSPLVSRRNRSKSPRHQHRHQRSSSPPRRNRSKTPPRRNRSKTPPRRRQSKSPQRNHRSKSPTRRLRSKTPPRRKRSKSPGPSKSPGKSKEPLKTQAKLPSTGGAIPKTPSNANLDKIIKDSNGKPLTPKQLNIRGNLYTAFPTADKATLDNLLESLAFNFEACSNFIRWSGVPEAAPKIITGSGNTPNKQPTSSHQIQSSSKAKSKDTSSKKDDQSSASSSSSTSKASTSSSSSLGNDFNDPPPVSRLVEGAESMDTELPDTPRSSGKLVEIIDSYKDSRLLLTHSSTDNKAGSETITPPKTVNEELKDFQEYNLKFLYEIFPNMKKTCRKWLRRYNGDLMKTCDYLSRLSQTDLPANEDDDDISEDFEMIDLTNQDEDDEDADDDDLIVTGVVKPGAAPMTSTSTNNRRGKQVLGSAGKMFRFEDNQESSSDALKVAIDKSLAMDMKNKFGTADDFTDGDLQYDDLILELNEDAAQQIYQILTKNLKAKKRKLESIDKDEEFAKRLQEEEDKQQKPATATASPAKQQPKKMRRVDIDTRYAKGQTAQLFTPKSAWNKQDQSSLTPIEGIGGGQLTLEEVNGREELYRMFPGVNEEALDQLLEANNYNVDAAANMVTSSTGAVRNRDLQADINDPAWKKVTSPPKKIRPAQDTPDSPAAQIIPVNNNQQGGYFQNIADSENISYQDLRAEAELYAGMRREALQKAAEGYQAKNAGAAQYYADKAKEHERKMKEAHHRAAELMLQRRNKKYMRDQKVIDLHGLHVGEAINALKNFLENAQMISRHREVEVITGRGNHSIGGVSKIRNAVINYLRRGNFRYRMMNAGGSVVIEI
uniref:Smr domain-containing protein n=1 Tax=Clytia hemisphaerica TaxID=252671 RepID=A0A7M5UC46_9CNID